RKTLIICLAFRGRARPHVRAHEAQEKRTMAKKTGEKKKARSKEKASARQPKAADRAAPSIVAPAAGDPRMPAPGTLLQKRDRHGAVRCECTVEADGIRYAGKLYRSLSSAALAAAKDLGLTNKTQNGFIFWGITKVPRIATDGLLALERAW